MSTPLPDTGVYPPPPYLSPSSIDTFNTCPLKYKLSRIDKMYDPPSVDSVRGNFVHECLEVLLGLDPEHRSIDAARRIMADVWARPTTDRHGDPGPSWADQTADLIGVDRVDKLREFRWQAWWCIENYFNLEDPRSITPAGIEHKLDGNIDGVPIRGFIDRWHWAPNRKVWITDFKTGKTPYGAYRRPKFVQLLIYADLLARELGVGIARVELLYLKTGDKLQLAPTARDIDEMRTLVTTTHVEITRRCDSGEFEPRPSKLCDWCNFKQDCPAWTT